jgi:hypothetical protein
LGGEGHARTLFELFTVTEPCEESHRKLHPEPQWNDIDFPGSESTSDITDSEDDFVPPQPEDHDKEYLTKLEALNLPVPSK